MEKITNFQTKIEFPEEKDVKPETEKTTEVKDNIIEKRKVLMEEIRSIIEEYCKEKNKKISFNIDAISKSYETAFNKCQKENKLKSNNPNYIKTPWKTIMMNHRPDFFYEKDWLEFLGGYHKQLSRAILDYQKNIE